MRIAVWHNLPNGGGKRALYDQVKGLLSLGHHVEAWCPSTADREYLPLDQLITEHVLPIGEAMTLPGNVGNKLMRLIRKWKLYRELDISCRRCAGEIRLGGYDVLLAHPCQYFSAPHIGRYLAIPKVLYLQEPCRVLYEALPEYPWKAREKYRRGENISNYLINTIEDHIRIHQMRFKVREEYRNAASFDDILVNSYFSRENVLRAYGLQSSVCYLGIDADHFMPDEGVIKSNIVITVGAIAPSKNIGFIIKALSLLGPDKPSLVCIGNGSNQDYKDKLIEEALQSNVVVEFMTNVSDKTMLQYLNKSKIFLYAPRLEPFGFTPLEANSCEIPVVAIAEGGLRETIINNVNGILVDYSPSQMADAIKYLLNNQSVRESLGKNGRLQVKEKWSLHIATKHLEQLLEKACQNKNNKGMPPVKVC
ncbi:glycosyltransferase family 4 protein [candidate division TA06 bacterium]|nr:glycosyltransferase family 4 protein [candidate division TA06 bacterium]